MANLNKVFLMGNLTRDPELRYTPSGTPVCEFGMAINRTFSTRDGDQREETCFVTVNMWGRRGEVISEYLSKGSPIFVEGRLKYDSWETSDGRRSKLVVVAENFEFLGGGGSGGGRRREQTETSSRMPRGERPSRQERGESAQQSQEEPEESRGFDVSDDEIPF
jgi:single-strand DNA-binding protein